MSRGSTFTIVGRAGALSLRLCLALAYRIESLVCRWFKTGAKPPTAPRKRPMDGTTAAVALAGVLQLAGQAGCRVFLISGTLLGLHRNGRLLPHDKDIDLGVMWDDPALPALLDALCAPGPVRLVRKVALSRWAMAMNPRFPALAQGTILYKFDWTAREGSVPVRVDLFIHFPCGDEVLHGSYHSMWANSSFELAERRYGTATYLVPADVDRYLAENYGEYGVERVNFESSVDCPNVRNWLSLPATLFLLEKLFRFHASNDALRRDRIRMRIESLIATR